MPPRPSTPASFFAAPITRVDGASAVRTEDLLAVEEPLEIRLVHGPAGDRQAQSVAITMRTPGEDEELAAGFLYGEGLVRRGEDVAEIRPCGPATGATGSRNVVRVELAPGIQVELGRLDRHFYTTSSCGVCGKSSLEAIATIARTLPREGFTIASRHVHTAPERLRAAQAVFERTGGLHAAGLFDAAGRLLAIREDVGRHNAVDKLVGSRLLAGALPADGAMLVVSGRASFELVQKAVTAGIPMLAAVGAPSSLAVELAREYGMTLAGFVRNGRFNLYAGEWRVHG